MAIFTVEIGATLAAQSTTVFRAQDLNGRSGFDLLAQELVELHPVVLKGERAVQ